MIHIIDRHIVNGLHYLRGIYLYFYLFTREISKQDSSEIQRNKQLKNGILYIVSWFNQNWFNRFFNSIQQLLSKKSVYR